MSIFLALPIPEHVVRELQPSLEFFDDDYDKPAPSSKWHITLAFLKEAPDLENNLTELVQPMSLATSLIIQLLTVNHGRNNRQLWANVSKSNSLENVRDKLLARLDNMGLSYDQEQAFHPHITLANLNDKKHEIKADWQINFSWAADKIIILESEPSITDSDYRRVGEINLN